MAPEEPNVYRLRLLFELGAQLGAQCVAPTGLQGKLFWPGAINMSPLQGEEERTTDYGSNY
jgi:hypothetical protein